ncbi:MAG: membrane protein insertase YidC, partial [Bacteroidota bacterium]
MNFDKNTIIGFVLLMILLFGYIFVTNQQQAAYMKEKHIKDSIANAGKPQKIISPEQKKSKDVSSSLAKDSLKKEMLSTSSLPEQLTFIENDLMKVAFTNKGGYPKYIEIKSQKDVSGKPVVLGGNTHQLSYSLKTKAGQLINSSEVDYAVELKGNSGSDVQEIIYSISDSSGKLIEHAFSINKDEYLIKWDIRSSASTLIPDQKIKLQWSMPVAQQEKDLKYEKGQSNIGYFENGEYDFDASGTGDSRTLGSKTQWIGIKQQFFNATVIAPNNFSQVKTEWTVPGEEADSLRQVMNVKSLLELNIGSTSSFSVPLQLYFGPNDYHILKKYGMKLESHVQLGYGIFAFVKYINRFVIMPVFDFLHNHMASVG